MIIIIIVVIIVLIIIIVVIVIIVLKRRKKNKRVAAIVPTDDSKSASGPKSKGNVGGTEVEMSPMNSKQRRHGAATAVGATVTGSLDAVDGVDDIEGDDETLGGRVNTRARRARRARRKLKAEANASPETTMAGAASYDHLDKQVISGSLTIDGLSKDAYDSDEAAKVAIKEALNRIPLDSGLHMAQVHTSLSKAKLAGTGGQLEVPFTMNLKVPSAGVATAICDDFNDQIQRLNPSFSASVKSSLERSDSNLPRFTLLASNAHVKGALGANARKKFGFKVGCNFSLAGISLEEFKADPIIKKSFQSAVDETLKGMGRNLTMGTPISVVKMAERKGKVIIRCQGIVEGVQEDVQTLADKFNASSNLGRELIPRWQENSLAEGVGTLQKNSKLSIGKYAMRVSKKITAAAGDTDRLRRSRSRKGEITLSGFKGFDTKDIPEMQSLLQKSMKRLKQFRDTDDVKHDVVVTGFTGDGDALKIKYRTKVQRLSRKAAEPEALPLDEDELLEGIQDMSSQMFAKKFSIDSIAVQSQNVVDPRIEAVEAIEPVATDTGELSNVTGFVSLEGVSKARLNRSPKVLNAMKMVILKAANSTELELPREAVTVSSIRTQVDKSIKVNYKIDLQGGTAIAADGAVRRLRRHIDPAKGTFLEDVQSAAVSLGETKLDILKRMKLKDRGAETVSAVSKRKLKSAADMVAATRRMLALSKTGVVAPKEAEKPQLVGDDGLVESRRSRRRRGNKMADTVTRTPTVEVAKGDEEAEVMERRRRRKQRGERRQRGEGKSPTAMDGSEVVGKLNSRRDRRRGRGSGNEASEDRAEDRRSRREQRRARRNGEGKSTGDDSSREARRAARRARKAAEGKSPSRRGEEAASPASRAKANWGFLRDQTRQQSEQRGRAAKLAPVGRSGSGAKESKKKGKLLRTVTDSRFDDVTDDLLKQVREAKAARQEEQSKKRTGLRFGQRARARSESKAAAEMRARGEELLMEELGM